jgi:Domain of unknown function (DUF4136)
MKMPLYACVALAVIPGFLWAQKVTTDSDPSAPFATYRTYAWTPGTPSLISLTEQRIHSAVDAQLQQKGLMETENNPSLYVASFVLTREEPQIVANGFGPWGFGGFGTAAVETYVQGTLIVDMYDASTKKMVWRGVATGTASDKPSKNTSKIDKALAKMFQRYPPSATSTAK